LHSETAFLGRAIECLERQAARYPLCLYRLFSMKYICTTFLVFLRLPSTKLRVCRKRRKAMRDLDLFPGHFFGPERPSHAQQKYKLPAFFAWRRSFFSNGENVLTQFQDAGTTLAMSQNVQTTPSGIHYAQYETEKEAEYLPQIRELISNDLSEPYSIYVYRYFLYQWADLCFMVCYHLSQRAKTLHQY
jgi:hypothetical protein